MGKGIFTKRDAASIAIQCASKYKQELNNKNLLFLCLNKHKNLVFCEVSFRERNYMHLTGLVPIEFIENNQRRTLTPIEFYNMCINKTLNENQFEFKKDGTTPLKLKILPQMITGNLSANMMGNYDKYTPLLQTDKLIGKTNGIIGFQIDKDEGIYLPNTLLNDDIRNLSNLTNRVILTFRKEKDAEKYNELTYKANKVEWNKIKLPKEYKYLEALIFGDEQGDDSRGDSSRDDGPDDGGSGGAGGAMGTPTVSDDTSSPSSPEKELESESSTKPDAEDKLSPIGEINIGGPTNEEIGKMSIEILKSETKPSLIDEYVHKDNDIEL